MRVVDRFPAGGFISGTRTLTLRSLPPGARIRSFRLAITPIADSDGAVGPGLEVLSFATGDVAMDVTEPGRATGVSRSNGDGPPPWTEIAFTGFRTLHNVVGTGLTGAVLQADVGGLFVGVDANGTIPDQGTVFSLPANNADLPGLSVRRIRLVAPVPVPPPVVTQITLRAVASNLTVALGDQPAAWALPGDVTTRVETADLATFAQAALADAPVEGGIAVLPVTIKTDTTARLAVEIAVDFDETRSGLPAGLPEMTLDYAHDGIADSGDDLLSVTVPDGQEIDPARSRIAITGTFEGSEITHGDLADRDPAGAITIAPGHAAAAPVSLVDETVADAVDLLLSTPRAAASVEIDLREDFDGKPGDVSLLAKPAGAALDVSRHGAPRWLSAALGQPVTLPAADKATGKPRIWVVVQSIAHPVAWHLNPDPQATAQMQTSDNGGLSWRPARVAGIDGGLAARLRLRRASPVFRVPVTAEIGRGDEASLLSLGQFQPLARVDFTLPADAFAGAVNAVLDRRRAAACPRGDPLRNGGFGDRDTGDIYAPEGWSVSGGPVGRQDFPVLGLPSGQTVRLIRIGNAEGPAQSISQVFAVSGGCPYRLRFHGFRTAPGARVELIWRAADCSVASVQTLDPPAAMFVTLPDFSTIAATGTTLAMIPAAALDTVAPETAEQAEIRVLAGPGDTVFADAVTLNGGPAGLINPDLREIADPDAESGPLRGWTLIPASALADPGFRLRPGFAGLTLINSDPQGRVLSLSQQVAVTPGAPFAAGLEAITQSGGPGFAAVWIGGDGTPAGTPLVAQVIAGGAGVTRLAGRVPDTARQVEIRIEIPPGADLTVAAVAAETAPPQPVPVAFLAEAPGRLTVRDFTVGFRPRPVPPPPPQAAQPCAPTPADAAPGDICEPDPCCGKPGSTATGLVATVPGLTTVDRPAADYTVRPALAPTLAVAGSLPAASATARLTALAASRYLAGVPPLPAISASRDTGETAASDLPAVEVNGVGAVRSTQLATLGIATVGDLARAAPDDLVRRLGYSRALARDLVARARTLAGPQPDG